MTALLLYEKFSINEYFRVQLPEGYIYEGKVAYLDNNDMISVQQLLEFLLVYSANDAANIAAIKVSGSINQFVDLMNDKAEELNMENTNFVNPDGLDDENQYTTLNDLLKLTKYIIKNTLLIDLTSKEKFYYEKNSSLVRYDSTNILIIDGFIGLKTGWTSKAGLTFIGYNQDENRNIITIVNRSIVDEDKVNHFKDTKYLYERSINDFQNQIIIDKDIPIYKIFSPNSIYQKLNINNFEHFGNTNTNYYLELNSVNNQLIEFNLNPVLIKKSYVIETSKDYIKYNFFRSNIISKLFFYK